MNPLKSEAQPSMALMNPLKIEVQPTKVRPNLHKGSEACLFNTRPIVRPRNFQIVHSHIQKHIRTPHTHTAHNIPAHPRRSEAAGRDYEGEARSALRFFIKGVVLR